MISSSSRHSTSVVPPGEWTFTVRPVFPSTADNTAARLEHVPEADVSPAPRSHIRSSMFSRSMTRTKTALTRSEQERARRILRDKGILQEVRRDVPARLYYRLDFDALASLLDPAVKNAGSQQTSPQEATDKPAASGKHTIPEITSKSTQGQPASGYVPDDRLSHITRALRAPRIGRRS